MSEIKIKPPHDYPIMLKIDYSYLSSSKSNMNLTTIGYFKFTLAIKDHKCDECDAPISVGDHYYCERYPKWLGKGAPHGDFTPVEFCLKCACKSPGLKNFKGE